MKIWTKYNIAEPAIRKTIQHFKDDWELASTSLESLDLSGYESSEDYETAKAAHKEIVDSWVDQFETWINSCYGDNRPPEDIIVTSSQTCHHGISFQQLLDGKREAIKLWTDFFEPRLIWYEDNVGKDDTFQAAYDHIWESVMALGGPHSFRCEFIWLITRVRYFEIIPTWELARIKKDIATNWDIIVANRQELLDFGNLAEEGIYSQETLNQFEKDKSDTEQFMQDWIDAKDNVWDGDGELHRLQLRALTQKYADLSQKIYQWHFKMGCQAIQKKDENLPINITTKENYDWTDQTRKGHDIARSISLSIQASQYQC